MSDVPSILLTAPQAAQALAISPRKLWSLTAANEIPHIRIGKSVRYPRAGLEQWAADRVEESAVRR